MFLAEPGEDPVRVGVEELDEPVLIAGKLEEVVCLSDAGDGAEDSWPCAVGIFVLFEDELFLAHAVVASVLGLVDEALVKKFLEVSLDDRLVPGLCGTDEVVVRNAQVLQESQKEGGDLVAGLLRQDAPHGGGLLDFLSMLVESREEVHIPALKPLEAHDNVGEHFFVGVAEVRCSVGVVYCSGDVKGFVGHVKEWRLVGGD